MAIRRVFLGSCCGFAISVAYLSQATSAQAAVGQSPASDLKSLSIEELMDVKVYSASRRLESTQAAPSALFVLTNEDLRRARVTNIPDALRLVPGVQVGQVDANKWAVSIRGFNSREANKLLVLVDGRSIYDPLFSGMLWESQDFLLEDIDRIEVIRGPGGTLWGANAVNGVINIITHHSRDTVGGLVAGIAGNEETYSAAGRYGWAIADHQFARVYVKSYQREEGFASAVEPHDASRAKRAGFRWDWGAADSDRVRISGDVFDATTGIRENPTLVQDVDHGGRNVLARWNHWISDSNELRVQYYYDHVTFESFGFDQERSTHDIELQQNIELFSRHQLVWGGGYRRMQDRTESGLAGFVDVLPLRRDDRLLNVFVQDSFALLPRLLNLIAGLKYEETDYASPEWLPNLRMVWTPDERTTWWAAASEAVRVPSRLESDLTFLGTIRIGDNMESEHVRAYEIGHRRLVSSRLWFDLATFYNDYDDLRTGEGPELRNGMRGHTYGAELALRWEPMASWRLDLAYTYLLMDLGLDDTSISDPGQTLFIEGLAPRHQASLRSMADLPFDFELDATLRFVDELASLDFSSYTQLDLSLSWSARPGLELALVGRNLLDPHQPEQAFAFSASGMFTETERSVYGRVIWSF